MVAQSLGIAKTQPWQGGHDTEATMSAGLQITLLINRGTPRTVELGPTALVGSGRAADVRVPDPAVASLHLRLLRDGDEVAAIALAPGALLDGVELPLDETRVVTGRTLDLGPLRLVAEPRDVAADATADTRGRTESLAREIVRDLMIAEAGGEGVAPELVVETGPASGQRYTLSQLDQRIVIGRGEHATWVLLDPDLSRSHATVVRGPDGARVFDMGSKNGTRVAGKSVPVGPPGVLLEEGAVIGLGDTLVRYTDPASALLDELESRMAAASSGAHAAVTVTRPGHLRSPWVVAVEPAAPSRPAAPPPSPRTERVGRRVPLGAILAALLAVLALALLAALLLAG
jgi:hypothetical protein